MTLAIKIGLLLCIIGALAYGYLIYTPVIAAPALTGKAIGKTIRVGDIDRLIPSVRFSSVWPFSRPVNQ